MLSSAIRISLSLSLSLSFSASLALPTSSPTLWRHKLRFRKLVRSHMRNTEVSRLLEHYAYIRAYLNITCIPIHIDTYASRCYTFALHNARHLAASSLGRSVNTTRKCVPFWEATKSLPESQRGIYKHWIRSIERLENDRFIGFSFSFLVWKCGIERDCWDGVIESIAPRNNKKKKYSREDININKLLCRMK